MTAWQTFHHLWDRDKEHEGYHKGLWMQLEPHVPGPPQELPIVITILKGCESCPFYDPTLFPVGHGHCRHPLQPILTEGETFGNPAPKNCPLRKAETKIKLEGGA